MRLMWSWSIFKSERLLFVFEIFTVQGGISAKGDLKRVIMFRPSWHFGIDMDYYQQKVNTTPNFRVERFLKLGGN